MKLLYPEEHLSCVNYNLDKNLGFSLRTLRKGEELILLDRSKHHILFLQRGKIKLTFKEVDSSVMYGGEMIYLTPDHQGKGLAENEVEFVLLSFGSEDFKLCEEYAIEELAQQIFPIHQKALVTPVYPPMQMVLDSVRFYLNNKISCIHLHQMKQKEIFLILRTFYSKKENADFFASLFVSA